jgi:hypothetical protein
VAELTIFGSRHADFGVARNNVGQIDLNFAARLTWDRIEINLNNVIPQITIMCVVNILQMVLI